MKPGRLISLIVGVLIIVPAIALFVGGAGLGIAYLVERDDDGYFDVTIDDVGTDTVAVTTEELDFKAEPGQPDWVLDSLDVDVRLRVTSTSDAGPVFVGIAPEAEVDRYLAGVAHAEVVDMDGRRSIYRTRPGDNDVGRPDNETFWEASATGIGTQELDWEATTGEWAVVLMNADASPGVAAEVNVGIQSDIVGKVALALFMVGGLLLGIGLVFIIIGATGQRREDDGAPGEPSPPASDHEISAETAGVATAGVTMAGVTTAGARPVKTGSPVSLAAALDPNLSRWKWLIKWFLAIPHFVVLVLLWCAFVVSAFIAGVAILFTGRYPRGLFDFNVGVMRWSWRVQFYASNGGIGTDEYPPFSLHPEPGDFAVLDVAYPEQLSRPMVLIKWLLAIPHLIIVALLAGSTVRWLDWDASLFSFDLGSGGGLLGLLTLVAGIALLFTNTYPQALFDLIVGFNRWVYRVVAYVALMTDDYPPFRLDQGGPEPVDIPPPPPQTPSPADIDLRSSTDERELTTF